MTPRVVIVHDQAAELGGQERVVQALLEHNPAAAALTLDFAPTNRPPGQFASWDGRTQLIKNRGRRRPFLAPFYGMRVSMAGVQDADVVLSVTQGAWSCAARVPSSAPHICYSSGLPQHLYGFSRSFLKDQPWPLRPAFAAALPALRTYDRKMLGRPERLIANSQFSARELERVHGRRTDVVYPPVRTHFFTPGAEHRRGPFLVVARLVSFKRVDAVVDAFRGLDERLVVAGDGPALGQLRGSAPPNVSFLGTCDDPTLLELYRSSRALICPSVETFGIAMGEAQACGKPVIAARAGGAPEVVREGVTGILLDRPEPRSIAESVRALDEVPLSTRACRESAERFAEDHFARQIEHILLEEVEASPGRSGER